MLYSHICLNKLAIFFKASINLKVNLLKFLRVDFNLFRIAASKFLK